MIVSRAARAANLAFAAKNTFSIIFLAVLGFSSKNSQNFSLKTVSTAPLASGVPSFHLVCHSNCGSTTFIEITAVNHSITSSFVKFWSFSFKICLSLAYLFIVLVKAVLKPVK
jgi:hypothetical protein